MIRKIITFRPSFTVRILAGLISFIAIIAACMVAGVADLTQALSTRDANFRARLIEEGARVYMDQCARCHGVEGKGIEGQGPSLSSSNFFNNRVREVGWNSTLETYIAAVTKSGIPLKSSPMWEVTHPPFLERFGGPLREDQIDNVVRFVMNWKQSPIDSMDVIEAPKPGEAFVPLPTPVPLTPAQEEGRNLFLSNGCNACHAIRGVANGAIGPGLNRIYEDAMMWIASEEYKASQGQATTPEEYIRESIVNPQAFIVPECPQGACPAGVMPPNYADTIPPADLDKIIDYLATLGRPAGE